MFTFVMIVTVFHILICTGPYRSYRLNKLLGGKNSYELEIYDMMRSAFMKYGFQVTCEPYTPDLRALNSCMHTFPEKKCRLPGRPAPVFRETW